ncbi:EI24 domain-containing protein [Croceimicrobium sp.]|uniref:EI24 domain-containing protein n=1 Tax=Croceimicrobium sp. TaxID=2828340 RepID=UPI003BACDA87
MWKFFQSLGISLKAYGQALPQMFRKGYRRYLALPILVYLALLAGLIWLMMNNINRWLNLILGWFGYNLGELEAYSFVIVIILQILMLFFMSSLFKYAVLILLAPFMSFLSEKVEEEQTGQSNPFSLAQMLKDVLRAIRINLLNFLREMGLTIVLWLLAFIPIIGLLSPILIFVLQSYFLGYGLMDYNAERWRWRYGKTESWMRSNKVAVTSVGMVFHALFLIPFLGWIFAPAWSVIAGTRVALDLESANQTFKA